MIESEFWQGVVIGVAVTFLMSLFFVGVAISCASEGTDSNH